MLKKILGTTGTRLLNAGLTFLILWITTNYLGREGVGIISLIILDISIILLIVDFIGGSAMGYFASRKAVSLLIFISYTWTFMVGILFYFILRLLSMAPETYNTIVASGYERHILILAVINALTLINHNILIGLEKIKQYNIIFSVQIITLTLVLTLNIFILQKHDVLSYVIALYCSLGTAFITGFLVLAGRMKFSGLTGFKGAIREILSYGSMTQLANIITLTNKRFSFFIINKYIGIGSLGVYSASAQITEGLRIIGQSISLVQFSRIANTRDMEYAKTLTIQLLKFTMFVTLLALAIILVLPEDFYPMIFGEEFRGIKGVIFALSLGVLSIAASMIFAHYFSGIGKPKYNMISSAFGLVATVTFAFILIPRYGIVGAGSSATIAYFISMLYQFVMFRKVSGAKLKEFIPTIKNIREFGLAVKLMVKK